MGPSVRKTLEHAIRVLESLGASYCVVGGIARSVHAEPRSTDDVDFAVSAQSQDEVDAVMRGLGGAGFVIREVFFKRESGHVATARVTWGDGPTRADLLFETSGMERQVVQDARRIEVLPGLMAPVIGREGLIAMKLIAGREQDLSDIAALMDAGEVSADVIDGLLAASSHSRRAAAQTLWGDIQRRRRERVPDLVPASKSVLRRFQALGAKPPEKKKRR
ncbi:MAG: nucleotidyl transferase AbiEii/AbiGii toxin family protein [Myxococcaceae bacterium]